MLILSRFHLNDLRRLRIENKFQTLEAKKIKKVMS